MIVINIASGAARNRFDELGRLIGNPRAVLMAGTMTMRREVQQHFAEKEKTPNRLGGNRTHFWNRIRSSTQLGTVTDRQGDVLVGDPRFAQKVFGGRIVAKSVKFLTIPVVPEAHGRRAKVLESELGISLFFLGNDQGGVLAARADKQGLKVYYACKTSVMQKPDPTALPPHENLERAAIEGAENYVRETVQGDQPK